MAKQFHEVRMGVHGIHRKTGKAFAVRVSAMSRSRRGAAYNAARNLNAQLKAVGAAHDLMVTGQEDDLFYYREVVWAEWAHEMYHLYAATY